MKRTPLNRQSPKRAAQAEERRRVVQAVLARDRFQCAAAGLVPGLACGGQLDVDEVVLRSGRPGGELDPDNCQVLCRRHHDWKHAHPEQAVELGLRRWSWE